MKNSEPVASVNAVGRRRIDEGHPWIYRAQIISGPDSDARTNGPLWVQVQDDRGKKLGRALWALESPIGLRMLGSSSESHPKRLEDAVRKRIDAAIERRTLIAKRNTAYRIVHAEGDDLPGLFVDRYDDVVVFQTVSIAMDALKDVIVQHLAARLGPRIVVERNDSAMREFEGLPRDVQIRWPPQANEAITQVEFRLGDIRFQADVRTDGKTGTFLDQADNHAIVAQIVPSGGRVLDAFTHQGGFALALAKNARSVLATDLDAVAVGKTRANALLNGFVNVEVRQTDAFALLRDLEARGETFECVILDPPALAKRGRGDGQDRAGVIRNAERGYGELLLRGFRVTAPGGILVVCSCSGPVTRKLWDDLVLAAAARAGRVVQILARQGAAPDHPERLGVSETGHLKCWILRVL
ncbi:MAG: class I SAM-dependent rRNA methyltransferase [Deltaproteobacteria bacterium]|nr:class I SAM-dependent rRNA methyltransferase [Deltaproteobacteria bacterium]